MLVEFSLPFDMKNFSPLRSDLRRSLVWLFSLPYSEKESRVKFWRQLRICFQHDGKSFFWLWRCVTAELSKEVFSKLAQRTRARGLTSEAVFFFNSNPSKASTRRKEEKRSEINYFRFALNPYCDWSFFCATALRLCVCFFSFAFVSASLFFSRTAVPRSKSLW